MKNKLMDLNNHLFAQLERLSDESVKGDKLHEEINRAKAVGSIAKNIIDNGKLVLDAKKFSVEHLPRDQQMPQLLEEKAG